MKILSQDKKYVVICNSGEITYRAEKASCGYVYAIVYNNDMILGYYDSAQSAKKILMKIIRANDSYIMPEPNSIIHGAWR